MGSHGLFLEASLPWSTPMLGAATEVQIVEMCLPHQASQAWPTAHRPPLSSFTFCCLSRLPCLLPTPFSFLFYHANTKLMVIPRGSSQFAGQVQRSNPKLLSRGEGRSLLKYDINVLLSIFEYLIDKKFWLSTRVWVSILKGSKLLWRG